MGLKRMIFTYEAQKIKGCVQQAYRTCSRSAGTRRDIKEGKQSRSKILALKKLFRDTCHSDDSIQTVSQQDTPIPLQVLDAPIPLQYLKESHVSWRDPEATTIAVRPFNDNMDANIHDVLSSDGSDDGRSDDSSPE